MIMIVFICVCIIIHRHMHYISILYAHMIMVALCAYGECGFWCSTSKTHFVFLLLCVGILCALE